MTAAALDPIEQNPVLPLSRRRAEKIYNDIILLGIAPVLTRSPAPDPSTDPKTWGKAAVAQGWNRIPYSEAREAFDHLWPPGEERGYNVGVRTGHVEGALNCVVVVDCDTPEALAWVREHLPPTPMRTLPSRLEHLYYRVEPGTRVKSLNMRQRMGLDIDLQADGKLVIAPGSIHPSGIPYGTPTPWPENFDVFERKVPVFDPGWFPPEVRDALVGEPVRRSVSVPASYPDGGGDPGEPDVPLERRVKRAEAYLDKVAREEMRHRREHGGKPDPTRVSVSGADGQRTLMSVAYALAWGFYLPPEVAAEVILRSSWNDLCCDKDGEKYPWEMGGSQGLLRKCAEVLTDDMVVGKERPRGYLLLRGHKGDAERFTTAPGKGVERLRARPKPIESGGAVLSMADDPAHVDQPWHQGWQYNDQGNAQRLHARFADRLIYVEGIGWLAWDGMRWLASEATAQRCAQITAELTLDEALFWEEQAHEFGQPERGEDPEVKAQAQDAKKQARAALDWARKSGDDSRVRAQLRAAQTLFAVAPSALDADPYLLACRNGYLDLRTQEFFLADPGRLVTKLAATDYDPQAQCPRWRVRLEEWLPEEELRAYVQEWAGLSLTGDASLHAMLLLYGRGRNGKGMIVNTLGDMLGDYCVTIDMEVLIGDGRSLSGNATQEQKLLLRGARMVRFTEASESGELSSKMVKSMASTDPMRGRALCQNSLEFPTTAKGWLSLTLLRQLPCEEAEGRVV